MVCTRIYAKGEYKLNSTRQVRYTLISIGSILFIILVLMPLGSVIRFAFGEGLSEFTDAVTSEEALQAFRNSLLIAFISTCVNLVVGTLIAFIITRYRFPGKQIFKALIDLPIAIPTAVVGLSLMMLYGPMGVLGPLLTENGIQMVMAVPGIVLAHVFVTFPFTVRSVSVVLERMDPSLEEAASTLGANGWDRFIHIVLPSIRSGMIAGGALTFTRSLGEFGATLFIAGGMVMTGPLYIYYLSNSTFDFQAATSVAVLLMVFPFLILLLLNHLVERMER